MNLLNTKRDLVINITITGDSKIRKLNKKYLNRDCVTDVLSFDYSDSNLLGEVIINKEQAQRQAEEYGNDVAHELAELVEHGVLHLLGVHHPDDDAKTVHGVSADKVGEEKA